jgi:hypothetical protein
VRVGVGVRPSMGRRTLTRPRKVHVDVTLSKDKECVKA